MMEFYRGSGPARARPEALASARIALRRLPGRTLGAAVRGVSLAAVAALVIVFGASPSSAGVFNPKSFTLANGLKVVVIENHRLPVVRQTVFYKVGSADDPYGKSGLAHYLEHLMFKGTKDMKPNEFSKVVARNGGRDNAYTSYDTTAYYQTVARDRLQLVMRMEADRMASLVIDPKEAVPERAVIIEERRSRTDNRPSAQFDEEMNAALYMRYPYQVPVIGWKHEMEQLTAADATAFYKRYYRPNNAMLVIAGDVTVNEVRPLAEKYFGPIPRGADVVRRARLAEPPHRAAKRVVFVHPRVRQPRIIRAYLAPSASWGAKKYADALDVLDTILGSGTTSRLYARMVIRDKTALDAGSYYDSDMLGPSSFGVYASPAPGVSVKKVETVIDEEIARLLAKGVTEQELATAKRRLLASAVFARDSLRAGPGAIGTAFTTGQTIESVETWPDRIKAVTAADVLAAARHVFRMNRSVTGELLPARSRSTAGKTR